DHGANLDLVGLGSERCQIAVVPFGRLPPRFRLRHRARLTSLRLLFGQSLLARARKTQAARPVRAARATSRLPCFIYCPRHLEGPFRTWPHGPARKGQTLPFRGAAVTLPPPRDGGGG